MKTFHEAARDIPVRGEVDVLVVGAGPAGLGAAICAARQGAKTLLLEQSGAVGGVATTGLMSHWTGKTQGGIYEEILDRTSDDPENKQGRRYTINPERLKTGLLELLDEAGCAWQLYTFVAGAIVEDGAVRGVITESKAGREAILAKIVIDASGDGDVAAWAGVPYVKGRESDGKMQPVTIMFKMGGVDTDRAPFPGSFEDTAQVPAGEIQALARKHLKAPAGHVLIYHSTLPGVVTLNMTNCTDIDGTDPESLTKGDLICRRQMDKIADFLREFAPGFENAYTISSASIIGVRETRHFKGLYTLTEQDILEAKVFEDWCATRLHFNFDVHNITGAGLDETGVQKHFPQHHGYTIPYRCLVPVERDGLLLAGRNISGTHMAHSNYRVMPICANMGQAAGIAAAICVQEGIQPRELDVKVLQRELEAQGVRP